MDGRSVRSGAPLTRPISDKTFRTIPRNLARGPTASRRKRVMRQIVDSSIDLRLSRSISSSASSCVIRHRSSCAVARSCSTGDAPNSCGGHLRCTRPVRVLVDPCTISMLKSKPASFSRNPLAAEERTQRGSFRSAAGDPQAETTHTTPGPAALLARNSGHSIAAAWTSRRKWTRLRSEQG